ncbi:MAG TPA: Hpt domain-containing protein [Planctomycetaceae bacterium]|nr:Hpt domain-containing protein [Planctomycetaceae bacterium]
MKTTLTPGNMTVAATYFDFDAALDRCCGDTDFLAEMVDLLQTTVATRRIALRAAVDRGDPEAIAEVAHALKGAVGSMTTGVPYTVTRELELLGMSGESAGADTLLNTLEISLDQLLHETRSWSTRRDAAT